MKDYTLTEQTMARIPVGIAQAVTLATVAGVQTTGAKYGSWTVSFAVRDSGGTLSVLGSPSAAVVHDGNSTT